MEGQNFQTKIVKCGVPQDFHLEPLLFLIYIDDLENTHHFTHDTKSSFGNKGISPHAIFDVSHHKHSLNAFK